MSDPYIGEIRLISWNFPPKGWAFCDGQFLSINQNQALFSLLGTTYGGNGQTTFALPDFRGRVPVHFGNGVTQGETAGQTAHTITLLEMPTHNHFVQTNTTAAATSNTSTPSTSSVLGQSIGAPSSGASFDVSIYGSASPAAALHPSMIAPSLGNQPHDNMQPYLVLNFIIALEGIFPSRN